MNVWCGKEMGRWTVRLDGIFIADFWREITARRLAGHLTTAVREIQRGLEQSAQSKEA